MEHQDLPQRWQARLGEHLRYDGQARDYLTAYDFASQEVVRLDFEDGSFAQFRYPVVIKEPRFNEVAVFTEHCGYHIFCLDGVTIT